MMSTQAATNPSKAWSWFPWAIVGSFAVVFAVNGALLYFAKSTFPGVAATKPYETGVAYNSVLAGAARQEAMGWQMAHGIDRGHVVLTFLDRDGAPLDRLVVTASIARPVGSTESFDLTFARGENGVYRSEQTIPAPGQWDLKLAARVGESAAFTAARRLIAP